MILDIFNPSITVKYLKTVLQIYKTRKKKRVMNFTIASELDATKEFQFNLIFDKIAKMQNRSKYNKHIKRSTAD
jgi:hypothetical protein